MEDEYSDTSESETDEDMSAEQSEKLRNARKLFEEAVDHTRDAHAEAHRALRFYHNTDLKGQWEAEDIAYLEDNLRPCISVNITKEKIDAFYGLYADAQRSPRVTGSGAEDKLLAGIIDIVKDQVLQDARYDRKSAAQLKTGTIAGSCGMHVEVSPSPKGKGWIEINLYRIMPFELHWDSSSIEADRSDARHVFWDRWLSKSEFKNSYPDHADLWSQLSSSSDSQDGISDNNWGEQGVDEFSNGLDDYDGDQHSKYYFDRQNRKVRVIRYEYKEYEDKVYATHTLSGERKEIDDEMRKRVEMAIEMGGEYEIEETKEEVVRVCEFVGPQLLAEYDSPGPFDGFSIIDYVYAMDEETGTPYGGVHNLFDPQMELNKSTSLIMEYVAQSTAPGHVAEVGQIVDEDQFTSANRMAGGVALVKAGALAEGRVQQRQITPPSPALMERAAAAMDAMDRVSGIPSSGTVQPASQAEAASTVALRYHKSRQVIQDPISNYEHAQTEIVRRVVEAISRAMPDDQIQSVVANESKFRVQDGMVLEMGPNPQQPDGPPVPKSRAALRNLRQMDWNLELEHSSENSTLRMMEFDVQLKMIQAGIPVDPEVLVETSTSSRERRERLKSYVEKAERSKAEGAKRESQSFDKQMQMAAQMEGMKAQETARHNRAEELLKQSKQEGDLNAKLAALWESADDNEKQFFLSMIDKRQNQRQLTTGVG